ncbi:E3 ubiquitin-protein ligase [Trichinella spiralis]|uniref:E3 ubiquitin-protein ligase n=1 Tax=Trichinella spiralis TaxID=6334 RepID=A0ABR3KQ97_TRISP
MDVSYQIVLQMAVTKWYGLKAWCSCFLCLFIFYAFFIISSPFIIVTLLSSKALIVTCTNKSELILPSQEYSDIEEDISETEDAPELSSDVEPPSSTDSSSDESSEGAFSSSTNALMSKNGSMQWYSSPMKKDRLAESNVIKLPPGPTHYAIAKIADIRSSFALFISSRMEKIILQMKNLEGKRLYKDAWKQTDEAEFHAYIGLLILAGIYKSRGEATSSLWNTENGRPIFPSAMSLDNF